MPTLTFEDFEPGQVYELGSTVVTEKEIVDFARQFDPQPFHLDPEAAKASVFGGLIASGWHTGAIWMRLYVDSLLGGASGQGS
jgi:acyl dehydratase